MNTQYQKFENFAERVEAIDRTKNDYVVPVTKLRMTGINNLGFAEKDYSLTDYAHGQICNKLSIPRGYYDRMADIPDLREYTVNKLLQHSGGQAYMIRTLEEKCRAFLSDKFFIIDNYDILSNSIFPAILPFKAKIEVKALSISDTRMYIQLIFKDISGEVKPGDVVYYGLTITNSEVGAGALDIKSFIFRLICTNGMVRESLFRKFHVGKRITDAEEGVVFQPDTVKKELEGYQLRIRDVVSHSLKGEEFEKAVDKLKESREDKIVDLTKTIENVTKRYSLTDKDGKYMMNNIIQEGEVNRYGLANSITSLAKQFDNPDKQYELEKVGSQVIELSSKDWKLIN